MRTYAEHLAAWVAMEAAGFDGVGFNEHHGTPYGSMNSPNLMAASISQRTKKMKILIYGNLLPIHEPLRLAEEIAMLDCLSNGRLIAGVARGSPREYRIYNMPLSELRARFDECFEMMRQSLDRGELLPRGQVLHIQGCRDLAAPRAKASSAGVGADHAAASESIEWAAQI